MNVRRLALAIAGTALAGSVSATPFTPFDVRAAGMGGTGVASAKAASAALFNPAMLSAQVDGDKFQILLGAGVNAADSDNLFDQVDEIQVSLDDLDTTTASINGQNIALNTYNPALELAGSQVLTLSGQLSAVNNDSLIAGLGTGLGVGVPGKRVGVGVFVTGNGYLAATPRISPADTAKLNEYAGILADGTVTSLEVATHPDIVPVGATVTLASFNPQSSANGIGVLVAEYGVALSREYTLANGAVLDVGVTPKIVDITMFDYTANIDNFDDADIDASNYETTDNSVDLDAGVVFRQGADSQWQYGLVAKNLAGGSYRTALGRNINIDTQLRAGVARMKEHYTLAVDLDLQQNDGTAPGTETQFLALGAEYDLKFLQARCGYRVNLANSSVDDAYSVGLGLGPLDISVIGNANDVGAYLQLGFGW